MKRNELAAAFHTRAKGDFDVVNRLVKFIDSLGYVDVEVKADNEPSIIVARDAIIARRQRPTRPDRSKPYHRQTNGLDDIATQTRKHKSALDARVGALMPANSAIHARMIEHACKVLNVRLIGKDGKTPYASLRNKDHPSISFEFGESVLANQVGKGHCIRRKAALSSRCSQGISPGISL